MPEPLTLTCMGTSVGKGILGKVGEYLLDPILQQFKYMCCFDSNITELETQLKKLEPTIHDVQRGVDEDLNNVKVIGSHVKDWLESANKVTTEVQALQGVIREKAEVKEGCLYRWDPNLKQLRYSLSKEAVKKTKVIVALAHQAPGLNYAKSSYNQPPVSIEIRPNKSFMEFESRRANMEDIIQALKQDEITLIGICGMGGIGKTEMVKEVRKRVMEEKLFDECALEPISQRPDLAKVQKRIADQFGLEDLKKHDDATVRASLLSKRLWREDKRTLLILDDVWENFDLEELGISSDGAHGTFKLLYTSRLRGIWNDVQNKKEIVVGVLSEEEAWELFRKKAGEHLVDSLDLQPIAKRIVNECGRLPLALAVIGSALAEKSTGRFTKYTWEDICTKLTCPSSTPADERLSSSLELSYNYIDEDAKRLFLLCCLFEEDARISVEDLARYAFGLSLSDGINEMREVRHRVFALAADLMRLHLLLDDEDQHVKVHDVVRDMGISVSTKSKDKRALLLNHGAVSQWPKPISHEQYTAISVISKEIEELPGEWTYPNVELLIVQCQELKKLPSNFFEGMVKLKVLKLNWYNGSILTLQCLRKLTTLSLEGFCGVLDNASLMGDLLNLEILNFRGSSIKELPEEIGKLVKLRLLDLRNTRCLTRIPPGVISCLFQLEELYFRGSGFCYWEGEGKGEKGENVNLRELDSLSHLSSLEIRISDNVLIPEVCVFANLKRHMVEIGDIPVGYVGFPHKVCKRVFYVNASVPICPDHAGIGSLLWRSDRIMLRGKGCNDLVRELQLRAGFNGLQQLKVLEIGNCETPECLANTKKNPVHRPTPAIFPILKDLFLYHAHDFKEICCGPVPAGSFGELTSIRVEHCHGLENLFQVPLIEGCLSGLEQLIIDHCDMMAEVLRNDQRGEVHVATDNILVFPNLKTLKLINLPSLMSFCEGIDDIDFPHLTQLSLKDIPQVKFLFHDNCNLFSNSKQNDEDGLLSLFPQKVSLPTLEVLKVDNLANLERLGHGSLSVLKLVSFSVEDCDKLLSVFTSQFCLMLRGLQNLTVTRCPSLEVLVEWEEGLESNEPNSETLFALKFVKLEKLPKLNCISKRDFMSYSFIQTLEINQCDSLRCVFERNMTKSVPQLRKLKISSCKKLSGIVAEENGLDESSVNEVLFPQLEILGLQDLPKLVSFFPNANVDPTTLAKTTDHHRNPLQPQPALFNEKVAIPSLKILKVKGLMNVDLWYPTSSFSKLKTLHVIQCPSLRNVFHASTAGDLANLWRLFIWNCSTLEAVVGKEELVGGSTSIRTIDKTLFPQLRNLRLLSLPNLTRFCHFTHPLDMPLLSVVGIVDCPKMVAFSLGPVSAVNLSLPGISWNGDLNNAIPLLKKIKEEEENEDVANKVDLDVDEDEDEDGEDQEEIKEEEEEEEEENEDVANKVDLDVDEDEDEDVEDQEEKRKREEKGKSPMYG